MLPAPAAQISWWRWLRTTGSGGTHVHDDRCCAAVGGAAGNEAELSKTYPSAAISRKLSGIAHPISRLAREYRSSYHVEVAEPGWDRHSSGIVDRTQRPLGGSNPRR